LPVGDTFSSNLVCTGEARSGSLTAPRLLSSASNWTGTKFGSLQRAAVANWRRQAVSSPRATPWRRTTSEMLVFVSKLSVTIRVFSSAVHRRRRRRPVITSIRRYESPSCLASGMAFAIAHLQRSAHASLYRRRILQWRGGDLMPVTFNLWNMTRLGIHRSGMAAAARALNLRIPPRRVSGKARHQQSREITFAQQALPSWRSDDLAQAWG
jgi:hypothetical protein